MKRIHIFFSLFFFLPFCTIAQNAAFIKSGKIYYEKRVNTYSLFTNLFKDSKDMWTDRMMDYYKQNNERFQNTNFLLRFTENKSQYAYIKEDSKSTFFFDMKEIAGQNSIVTDLKNSTVLAQKNMNTDSYEIADSLSKITWKITDEYREIAGFNCRRANGLLHDSIYVVAFYTDQIIPSVGPESLYGLPGAILGAAMPHDYTTWFATKVINEQQNETELIPQKGRYKKYNSYNSLYNDLKSVVKDWEQMGAFFLRRLML